MEEKKNSEKQNKSTGQQGINHNNKSFDLVNKTYSCNNVSKKEKNDYKSFLKKYNRSLYELFTSELFTIELLLDYLIHKDDKNMIDFLVDILYNRFQENILYYLPQLCSLTTCKIYYNPIESFIINYSSDDLKFAVSANWIYESFIQDNYPEQKKKQFIKFIESLEQVMINGAKDKKANELTKNFYLEKEKREKELEEKRQKFDQKVEKISKEFNDKIMEKMKKMEEREKNRQEKNEKEKIKKMKLREEKNIKNQERIEKNKINLMIQMEKLKDKYEMKKLEEQNRLQELEEKRYEDQIKREIKQKEREEHIKEIQEKNEEIQEKKLEDYYRKQENIELKKEELRKINEYEDLERMEKIMQINLRRLNALERKYKISEKKKFETEIKMKIKADNVQKILKTKEIENMKNIKQNQENYDKVINEHENLIIMDKKKREEMAILLQQKSDKIDKFKQKKIIENEKKSVINTFFLRVKDN